MTLRVIAIAAMDEARVIGAKNALPWSIPEDSRRFFSLTKGHAVLMGRKTYESLPARFRPLPQRRNLVISRSPAQLAQDSGIEVHTCACELIDSARSGAYALPSDKLWIIGGEQIYRLTLPYWDEIELTLVSGRHEGDAFFPEFENNFTLVGEEVHEGYKFLRYLRV